MQVYRRLLHLVRPYLSRLFLAMFCMLVVAGATAATAYLVKPVLDKIFFEKNLRMPVIKIGRKLRKISTSSQIEMGELSGLMQETFSGAHKAWLLNQKPPVVLHSS